MDNKVLIILLVIQAIVIIWLASKLKQFQKFEQILKALEKSETSTAAIADGTALSKHKAREQAEAAASAVSSVAIENQDGDSELLDMPGVDLEANIEEAKRVQLVMARCRYAEFYLEQLDDDYERGQFEQIIESCQKTARNISDPFFRSSALEQIILLLDKAEWPDQRDQLIMELSDELIRQRVDTELNR